MPASWEQSVRLLTLQVDLTDERLSSAVSTAQNFLNPIAPEKQKARRTGRLYR